jgi:ferritin-like metal-binding protein YciE
VLEGLVTGGACKTEHYEIAAYTGLVEKARAMGQTEAAQLLQQNLQEEQQMLRQVEQISQQLTQQMASMSGMQSSQQANTTTS